MRKLLVACLAATAGQVLASDLEKIQACMDTLREHAGVSINLESLEVLGNRETSFSSTLNYLQVNYAGEQRSFFEQNSFRGPTLLQRTVGDGTLLWSFNAVQNEYTKSLYGAFSGQQPDTYLQKLMNGIQTSARAGDNHPVRLLKECFGSDVVRAKSWAPGAYVHEITEGKPALQDPISGETYVAGQGYDYVAYELGSPIRRSVVFERYYDQTHLNWEFGRIWVNEITNINGQMRKLMIVMTATGIDASPTGTSFTFRPPMGAKPIVSGL